MSSTICAGPGTWSCGNWGNNMEVERLEPTVPPAIAKSRPEDAPGSGVSSTYAWFVLALLTLINLVNYIDRQIVASVSTSIQADIGLNDEQFGYVLSSLIISFTI